MRIFIYLLLSTLILQSRSTLYQNSKTAFQIGHLTASEGYMRSALKKLPNQQGKIYFNLGQIFLEGKRWDSSRLYFEKSLHLLPDTWAAEARNNLGYIGIQEGDYNTALKQFRLALRKHPQNSNARINYELAYRKMQTQLPPPETSQPESRRVSQISSRRRRSVRGESSDLIFMNDSLDWDQLPQILRVLQEKEFIYLQQLERRPKNYSLSSDKPNW